SSTFLSAAAGRAVDGSTDGDYFHNSVSVTAADAGSWWQVDLGGSAAISSIKIWNRTAGSMDRLSDYWVFVSNTPFGAGGTIGTLQGRAGTWSNHQTSYPNPATSVTVNSQGRYVRVQLSAPNYLQLAEVQVFGIPPVVSVSVSPGAVTLIGAQTQQFTAAVTN